jgi:uncharacterized membrane protein
MTVLQTLALASYPFLVYGGLSVLEPRTLAVVLGAAFLLRGVMSRTRRFATPAPHLMLPIVVAAPVLALAGFLNEERMFLLMPPLINAALLTAFGWTLWKGPSMVEHFARMQGQVSPEVVSYCRAITGIWCLFFILNGGIALGLALYASVAHWALYTGVVAYVLIGILFVAEAAYRRWRFPDPLYG